MLHSNEPNLQPHIAKPIINENNVCNKQRNYLIKAVKDFLEIKFSDAHILAVLYKIYGHSNGILKKEDKNILFEKIVFNKYAKYHGIRYEDSVEIILNFIITLNLQER